MAWLALFAIVLNALAPAISRMQAPLHSAQWVSEIICSVKGAHQVSRQLPLAPASHDDGELCPFCVTHAGSFGLAAIPHSQPPVWPVQHAKPFAPIHASSTAGLFIRPLARAPPAHA